MQARHKRGAGGAVAPQFLAEQLTLSQPGGQIMPTTVLQAPPDFQTLRRPCICIWKIKANKIELVDNMIDKKHDPISQVFRFSNF